MLKIGQDVSQVRLAHPRYLLDWSQSTPNRPPILFPEIPLRFLHLVAQPKTAEHLFNRPGARSLQVEFLDCLKSLGMLGGHILHPIKPELPGILEDLLSLSLQAPMLALAHFV